MEHKKSAQRAYLDAVGKFLMTAKLSNIKHFSRNAPPGEHFPLPPLPPLPKIEKPKLTAREKRLATHRALDLFSSWLGLPETLRKSLNRAGYQDAVLEKVRLRQIPSRVENLILSFELSKSFDLRLVTGFTRTAEGSFVFDILDRSHGLLAIERDRDGFIRCLRYFRSARDKFSFSVKTRAEMPMEVLWM